MNAKIINGCLMRLARIEGQVREVRNMLEQDRYCIDVLTQINAPRAALDRVEQEILREHLWRSVARAFDTGSPRGQRRRIDELITVLDSQRR